MTWDYFPEDELRCKCGCGKSLMDPLFMQKLVKLRMAAGFAFNLTSAYRCSAHNQAISVTGDNGPHTTGKAVDIALWGRQAHWLLAHAGQFGMTGIGIKQTGDYQSRFIHIDDLEDGSHQPRPWVWTYR